jgi:hypothetical protein
MASQNQNPVITPKFRVGDIAYIHSIRDRWGRETIVDACYRIDGIGIGEGDGIPIYNVTLLNGTPYGTGTGTVTTMTVRYLDSRATLAPAGSMPAGSMPAGSMKSAGPNGGRKSYRNLKKRKSGKTRKLRKTRRNKRKRRI